MKNVKLTKSHDIWEIWNEMTAETAYFIGKPTPQQVLELVRSEWYESIQDCPLCEAEYICHYIHVDKLPHVYCAKNECDVKTSIRDGRIVIKKNGRIIGEQG